MVFNYLSALERIIIHIQAITGGATNSVREKYLSKEQYKQKLCSFKKNKCISNYLFFQAIC